MKHGDICEPCGECEWCRARWRYRDEMVRRGRVLRSTRRLLIKVTEALLSELQAAGPDEVQINPILRKRAKLVEQVRRFLQETDQRS